MENGNYGSSYKKKAGTLCSDHVRDLLSSRSKERKYSTIAGRKLRAKDKSECETRKYWHVISAWNQPMYRE